MRHSVRARLLQTLACAVCTLALPPAALAADSSGVHIDPSSPVAKEYALPLATARGAPPESGRSGRLFGSGIRHVEHSSRAATRTTPTPPAPPSSSAPAQPPTPVTPSASGRGASPVTPGVTSPSGTGPGVTGPGRRPTRRRAQRQPPHVTTVTLPALTTAPTARPLSAAATPAAYRVLRPGSGWGLLWMVLAAAVVVALGSAGGLLLRHRR
ncbi:MAG: hypothetical protein KGL16_13150 [Acidobacteriota bacterium]|nr:hypothetical protein [Acidobacteriota bacterium]